MKLILVILKFWRETLSRAAHYQPYLCRRAIGNKIGESERVVAVELKDSSGERSDLNSEPKEWTGSGPCKDTEPFSRSASLDNSDTPSSGRVDGVVESVYSFSTMQLSAL